MSEISISNGDEMYSLKEKSDVIQIMALLVEVIQGYLLEKYSENLIHTKFLF